MMSPPTYDQMFYCLMFGRWCIKKWNGNASAFFAGRKKIEKYKWCYSMLSNLFCRSRIINKELDLHICLFSCRALCLQWQDYGFDSQGMHEHDKLFAVCNAVLDKSGKSWKSVAFCTFQSWKFWLWNWNGTQIKHFSVSLNCIHCRSKFNQETKNRMTDLMARFIQSDTEGLQWSLLSVATSMLLRTVEVNSLCFKIYWADSQEIKPRYLFRFSEWWRFLCRIVGNVIFPPGDPLLNPMFLTI